MKMVTKHMSLTVAMERKLQAMFFIVAGKMLTAIAKAFVRKQTRFRLEKKWKEMKDFNVSCPTVNLLSNKDVLVFITFIIPIQLQLCRLSYICLNSQCIVK